jgi:carbamoyltransferase
MIVLGIIDSKPSALSRKKMATGVPRAAIDTVLRVAGVAAGDLEHVAVAQRVSIFEPEPKAWPGWFAGQEAVNPSRFDALGASLAPVVGRFPLAWKAHHVLKMVFRERTRKLPALLRQHHGITCPIRFYDHHHCHATSAYFTSGFSEALVVTLDGGGDGLSGSAYEAKDGRLRRLGSVDSFNSLGNFYSYVTALCGFTAEKHEGKTTGLAAYGDPRYVDILRRFIRYEDPGKIRYTIPMYHQSALRLLRQHLPKDFSRDDLAASVQVVLEEVGTAFARYWLRETGLRRIAVAGGVFANVKLNQRIHELDEVDGFFVHPAMDDSGLSVGSALATLADERPDLAQQTVSTLSDVYLGPEYRDADIVKAIDAFGCHAERPAALHETIARLLGDGHVVARFMGRMEYGPRALGARSILYQTTDPSVNDWLNDRLQRTEFMPFAPATLTEHAARCYENLSGAEDPARFMTITFTCTPEMSAKSPGVVHVDNTARPQLIDSQTAPDLFQILSAYHRLTGIPSIINTSFNMHEEPIVCTPEDALRAFKLGGLDYLAIGDYLIRNPSVGGRRAETQKQQASFETSR